MPYISFLPSDSISFAFKYSETDFFTKFMKVSTSTSLNVSASVKSQYVFRRFEEDRIGSFIKVIGIPFSMNFL